MTINGFDFSRLDLLRKNIKDTTLGIPTDYGIYQWVYWPQFDENTITVAQLTTLIKDYSKQNFYIEEEFLGTFKFQAKIWEQGYRDNNNMFGLSDKNHKELEDYFQIRNNIIFFSSFFQEICFVKPFYIGKADNLQSRLSQHLSSKTNVIPQIFSKGIPEINIWVGHKSINKPAPGSKINTIFEEIYSRRVKPGLSIKPN
jgi:hypothetical protein